MVEILDAGTSYTRKLGLLLTRNVYELCKYPYTCNLHCTRVNSDHCYQHKITAQCMKLFPLPPAMEDRFTR